MLFNYLRKPNPTNLLTSPDSFRYFEYGMFCMGWHTPATHKIIYYITSCLIFAWCAVYLPIGIIISFKTDINTFTPNELLTVMQLFFNSVGMPFKVLFFNLYISGFYKAKKLLSEMDKRCTTLKERVEVHQGVVRCNKAYLIYQFIYTAYTISTFLSAALSGKLPWRIYNPFVDFRESRSSFWKAALNETALMLFAVTQTLMSDIYPLLYGLILRVHLKLLRLRVESLCTDSGKSDAENEQDLIKCIKDHNLIIDYAAAIRPAVTRTIFVQFLLIGICLGLSMINLLFFADIWTGLATVAYINGLMVQTFPFCFVCDLLKKDCELLVSAIFHSNWINSSRSYKSSLRYFLKNAQKSIAFTAGSIFPISTGSNIKVAKLAFSVVTFVNQLNIADRLTKN
uniref:Odorant receptor 98a n=1 Tax=Drosophila melanogaster TaxID=7227 RepID=OR98A_DROME|nr:odorant receptor 98a [Drosophila melanogaster]Q9VAZ3.2 RecName: Full=Odorant receptor 98a [Drosophila melanogaster]AAF56753.2 odorant receptor 98a [Drosophila melanogaster]|eukprot:NP_524536.2 odorant receptor 98a [Drosophila melanogaster]